LQYKAFGRAAALQQTIAKTRTFGYILHEELNSLYRQAYGHLSAPK